MIDPVLTQNLLRDEAGIWRSPKCSPISYPPDAHEKTFGVEENSFWFQHRNDCILSVIKKFPPRRYIIDVGGGNGVVSQHLQNSGFKTILLESGPEGIKNAKKRNIHTIFHTTFEDARFPENATDSLGMFDVLEHVENDFDFLEVAYRCMKQTGRLYITVPAHKILWSWTDVRAGHFRRYSIKSLTKVLSKTGFEVKFISHFFSGLWLPIFLFRTLPSVFGKKTGRSSCSTTNDHIKGESKLFRFLNWYWEKENKKLSRGKIAHGSSIISVSEPVK
jgi:SAM-dependent methyltransferase